MSVTTSGGSPGAGTDRSSATGEERIIQVGVQEADGGRLVVRRDERASRPGRPPSHRRGYTKREHEILELVAAGQSNAEIARALGISRRTVEKHVESIHAKAGTTTRARLVAYALSVGFPPIEPNAKDTQH